MSTGKGNLKVRGQSQDIGDLPPMLYAAWTHLNTCVAVNLIITYHPYKSGLQILAQGLWERSNGFLSGCPRQEIGWPFLFIYIVRGISLIMVSAIEKLVVSPRIPVERGSPLWTQRGCTFWCP
jgi:hypothetical protein